MTEIPAPQNKTANVINKIIEVSIMDVGVRAAKAAATAELPFLAWPGISQMFDYLLKKIAKYFYMAFATQATFAIIEAQAQAELEAYNATIDNLKKAVEANDQAAIDAAREEFKRKLQDLIRFNGEARIK
jgi:hypothetical protein